MQNNIIEKISPSIRIIVLILLTIIILLAKSIYLILFITTFILILFIITDKKVNIYVNFFKKTFLLLLFFFIIYIIIFRISNIIFMIMFIYKLLIIDILVKIFIININFRSLHEGIYGCLKPLKKKINIENISFDITLSFCYIKFLLESTEKIKNIQRINGKKIINIKNYFIPSFIFSINELDKLKENLKIKFYQLNYKKTNVRSRFVLILFIILFIVCIYKEVIL